MALKHILRNVRPIGVLKCRFQVESVTIYGLLMFIFNYRTKKILRYSSVSGCNPSLYETDTSQPWYVFEKNLYSQRLRDGSLREVTQKLEQQLLIVIQEEKIEEFYQYWDKSEKENIAELLKSAISAIVNYDTGKEYNVDIELTLQKLNLRQFKYLTDIEKSDEEFKLHINDEETTSSFIVLDSELVKYQAGIPTEKVEKLEAGDVVFTEIKDSRDIGRYLSHLLGARKGEELIPLSASIEEVKDTPEGVEVIVRYGPGIVGRILENPKKKVAIVKQSIAKSYLWKYILLIALLGFIYYILIFKIS